MGFENVGELVELSPAACDYEQYERGNPLRWLLVQATESVEHKGYSYPLPPKHVIAFSTLPANGSEPANFGLCLYPRTVTINSGAKIRTGLPSGWSWHSFCKTQYASDPQLGGAQNFLRAHLLVIGMLDRARELGILKDVSDEGEYWEKRDAQALVTEVGQWNAAIAAFAGQLKDQLSGIDVQAPIVKFSNFEHLEAEGRAGESGGASESV